MNFVAFATASRNHLGLLLALVVLCSPLSAMAADSAPAEIETDSRIDLLVEGFEDWFWPPSDWALIHEGTSWQWTQYQQDSHTGNNSAAAGRSTGDNYDEYLVTRAIDLSQYAEVNLEWYERADDFATAGHHHYIMVSTTSQTDPATFEVAADMTPGNHTVPGWGGPPTTVNLNAFAGNSTVYIAFRYTADSTNHDLWLIDDVVLNATGPGHDVLTQSVTPNGQHYDDGESFVPGATVLNNGQHTESFDVEMEILASGTPVYSETQSVASLAPGASTNVSFPSFTVETGHLYTVAATTMLAGDDLPANDRFEAYNESYDNPHVPMGILFTNAGCGPCVQANQALDAYIPTQGNDVALMRVHVWWPGNDIMYDANTVQAGALVSEYGVSGVPNMFLDGFLDLGSNGGAYAGAYNARKLLHSPNNIDLAFNPATHDLTVTVRNTAPIIPGNYRLRAVITEDNFYYAGSNGEVWHNQVFRYMYPDLDGVVCPTSEGNHTIVINCALDPGWRYEELRATVYIQNIDTTEMIQAGTNFLEEIDDPVGVESDVASVFNLGKNYPNPFNPMTTIDFSVPRDQLIDLSVYALDGTHVATLLNDRVAAGTHQAVWNGNDDRGRQMPSGTYFYRIRGDSFSETKRMMLVK